QEAEDERRAAQGERARALLEKENAEHSLAMKTLLAAQASWREPNVPAARRHLEDVPEQRRGWEWGLLRRQFDGGLFTLHGHTSAVRGVAVSGDGQFLASIDADDVMILWDARSGELLRRLPFSGLGELRDVAFSPDGRTLALAHGGRPPRPEGVVLWDVERD